MASLTLLTGGHVTIGKTHIKQAEYMALMEKQAMHESAESCREPFEIFDT
jgi:hypothetical protein